MGSQWEPLTCPSVRSVHRTHTPPHGHRVSSEDHFCPSTQCSLFYPLSNEQAGLTTRLVNSSQTHRSLLWDAINRGHFQVRPFWLFLSRRLTLYLSGDPVPTFAPSQSPQRRDERDKVELGLLRSMGVGQGISNEQELPGSLCYDAGFLVWSRHTERVSSQSFSND